MELKMLYTTTAAALLAFSSTTLAQTQSGSSIGSSSGMSGGTPSTGTTGTGSTGMGSSTK